MKFGNILVLGGSGFIGRHLVAALARRGLKVVVPSRRRERAKHLILLPTVEVIETDIFARGALDSLTRGRDAVINLVGILHGRRGRRDERGPNDYGPDFARAHVEFPQAVIAACRAQGVGRLLHISALGAAADAPSEYLRSKGIGEKVVLAADDLDVTVFRPSVVFGPEDRFLNQFATLSKFLPVIAPPCPRAQFQPVYVGDVARALAAALDNPAARDQRYALCGPRVYTLMELVAYVCRLTRRRRLLIGLPDRLSYLAARLMELTPGPLMSRDNFHSMQVANVCGEGAPLPFGMVPESLESVVPTYLLPLHPKDRYPQLRWKARR
jgi:NADH dehydrogenase